MGRLSTAVGDHAGIVDGECFGGGGPGGNHPHRVGKAGSGPGEVGGEVGWGGDARVRGRVGVEERYRAKLDFGFWALPSPASPQLDSPLWENRR